ncbi:hypothetical protein [Anatilimnocola floriformis]|uniref:hypothetical protein n=1 Tax=Anatilimnocola floriformis TaxID=2948575 RepID=UPI0020C346A0|nr:hypothetical protein [Anatilimnocola floriformis]
MQDILVGAVTCLVGLVFIFGAATNNQFLLDLQKSRWLSQFAGRTGARVMLALLGLGLVVLGGAIIRGWRLPLFG